MLSTAWCSIPLAGLAAPLTSNVLTARAAQNENSPEFQLDPSAVQQDGSGLVVNS